MPIVDIAIIVTVLVFLALGLKAGFVHTLGSLIGTLVGTVASAWLVGPALDAMGLSPSLAGRVIIFIILFLLISHGIGFIFWLISKSLHFLSWIPTAKFLNHLLGGAIGAIEGLIVVAVVLLFSLAYAPEGPLREAIMASFAAPHLVTAALVLKFLLPGVVKTVTVRG